MNSESDSSNFMDELFARINTLQKDNEVLREELRQAEKEFEAKEVKEMMDGDEHPDTDVLNKIRQMNNNEETFKKVVKKENQMGEVVIEYVPFDNFLRLSIAGDFTNWERKDMEKTKSGTFAFKTLLLKGFQYGYCFYYNNELLIDFEREYLENTKTGSMNNVLILPASDPNAGIEAFDVEKNYKLLEDSRRDFHRVTVNDEDEYEIFNKIIQFSNFIKENIDALSFAKEDKLAENAHFYDEKLAKLNELTKAKFQNLNEIFVDRIFETDCSFFIIKGIHIKEGIIKGIRLYDKNGIKIDIDFHIEHSQLESFPIKDIFNNTYLYSREESEIMLMDYKDNTTSILKIYYQLLNNNESEDLLYEDHGEVVELTHGVGFGGFGGYGGMPGMRGMHGHRGMMGGIAGRMARRSLQKEIIPYKVYPDHVDINQYNMEIHDNKIVEIRNGSGLRMIFEAILIKEESGSKLMGLISSSSLKVYTTLYNKDIVNIIHIHLNDTSEQIAVESVFLEKHNSVQEFKNFPVDSLGKKLNYKFLFRDYKLIKIFYNMSEEFIDEPHFEEIKLKKENIIKIHNHDVYANYFGKVKNIPLGMLARKDKEDTDLTERLKSSEIKKEGYCQERHLEELPGFVDVEICFSPDHVVLEKIMKLSIPVCRIIPLTPKEELNFQKAMMKTKFKKVDSLYQKYVDYEKYLVDGKTLSTLLLGEAKEILADLESDIKKEEYISSQDDNESIEKINFILNVKEKLTPQLHQHIRVLILTGGK